MRRSVDRICTTHVGSLARPPALLDLMRATVQGRDCDPGELAKAELRAVADVVARQRAAGLDVVSDGEQSKTGFFAYIGEKPPRPQEPQMRVGISGTHGTGKTTLAQALCAHLPGHVTADEPYYLLEEEGYEFGFPPSLDDYRALLARSVQSLTSPPVLPRIIFDRTPLDYLAYLSATGADPSNEADPAVLGPALASLDLLVITVITPETEQALPPAEMPGLRSQMNDALLELVYGDPLNAWEDTPVLELHGPLDSRLHMVRTALEQARRPARWD